MIGIQLAGRYTVVSELGRGGMGVVYRARDAVLSRDVAVKLVPPQLVGPATRERFQREAQLVARLDHPAIIAIHDTTLGPALGGTRMWPYKSTEEALRDVLRLARGMTLKSAAAGLNLGGGKAVIIGDPKKQRNEMLFRAFGRYVEGMGGRYITAEDVGTNVRCMEWVRMETNHVTGISRALGGSGDPSPVTAVGVFTCERE